MLISVHMPKTAGSSFSKLLQEHYKKGFKPDYNDFPMSKSFEVRTKYAVEFNDHFNFLKRLSYTLQGVKCIHGHFLPHKYAYYIDDKESQYITWLRDPLERLASHYHFMYWTYDEKLALPIQRRVVEEKWTLEEFCFSEEMHNVFGLFFWNFPIERFDFIGISEHFDEDLVYYAKTFLNKPNVEIPKVNVNKGKKEPYFTDTKLIEALKIRHKEDYEIYNYALRKREERGK